MSGSRYSEMMKSGTSGSSSGCADEHGLLGQPEGPLEQAEHLGIRKRGGDYGVGTVGNAEFLLVHVAWRIDGYEQVLQFFVLPDQGDQVLVFPLEKVVLDEEDLVLALHQFFDD
jgi:hypothetical protein